MIGEEAIGERYRALAGELDERRRRLWASAEACSHGRGGLAAVVPWHSDYSRALDRIRALPTAAT